jgi:hypothetical protein
MKTQKKNGQGLYLQKKNNNRWKWMAGATAATAAGAASAQGGMITVNLVGNFISATGGNHLNADLTGDGQADLVIANATYFALHRTSGTTFNRYAAAVQLNGLPAFAIFDNDFQSGNERLASRTAMIYRGYGTPSLTGSIPISFKDLRINDGALTSGSLEVTVSAGSGDRTEIQLDSFTYNTRENVPDQGSSLALLAIGASGVLALRRLRTAQKYS